MRKSDKYFDNYLLNISEATPSELNISDNKGPAGAAPPGCATRVTPSDYLCKNVRRDLSSLSLSFFISPARPTPLASNQPTLCQPGCHTSPLSQLTDCHFTLQSPSSLSKPKVPLDTGERVVFVWRERGERGDGPHLASSSNPVLGRAVTRDRDLCSAAPQYLVSYSLQFSYRPRSAGCYSRV